MSTERQTTRKKSVNRAKRRLLNIQERIGGEISKIQGVYTLRVDEKIGKGHIKCLRFNKCMKAVLFDVRFNEDVNIPLNTTHTDTVYFLYCLEGDSCLYMDGSGKHILRLNELQTAAVYSGQDQYITLNIGKESRCVFTLIGIDKKDYQAEYEGNFHGLGSKLRALLNVFNEEDMTYHLGDYNLKIGEQVKLLEKSQLEYDITSFLYFEGLCNIILANQIEQLYKDFNEELNTTSLTQSELQRTQEISDYIRNYPEIQHSIKMLCSKSGLSPNKLQEGFKFMHNRTVSDFIRNIRIEKAEELIKNTDLNISEVVYSIGLTSRSYFCKIFKKKYRCSPKQYKNMSSRTLLAL